MRHASRKFLVAVGFSLFFLFEKLVLVRLRQDTALTLEEIESAVIDCIPWFLMSVFLAVRIMPRKDLSS